MIDGIISYDELGFVRIGLQDICTRGKLINRACVSPPVWYELQKWGAMTKVAGSIKLGVTLAYGANSQIGQFVHTLRDQCAHISPTLTHPTNLITNIAQAIGGNGNTTQDIDIIDNATAEIEVP